MITGSMAMAIYSLPRMTRDIDLVVEVKPSDVDRVVELFKKDCYIDRDAVRDAINSASMFNVIHREWMTKADFIVKKDEVYRKEEFARRRRVSLGNMNIFVVSIEDLILSKLIWRKQSRSELQLADVRQLIAMNAVLDWDYLNRWGKVLGVDAGLHEAKKDE